MKPQVLQRIEWDEVRAFIDVCIAPADLRPTASELLHHPFLAFTASNPERDDHVCPVREKAEEAPLNSSHRQAAAALPHLPVASSPTTAAREAALAPVPAQSHSPSQPPPSVPTAAPRARSPPESPLHRVAALTRQASHEPERDPHDPFSAPSPSPPPVSGLSLSTFGPSHSHSPHSPHTATSPTQVGSPHFPTPRTSGTARPPMISTQHHVSPAPPRSSPEAIKDAHSFAPHSLHHPHQHHTLDPFADLFPAAACSAFRSPSASLTLCGRRWLFTRGAKQERAIRTRRNGCGFFSINLCSR